MWPWQSIGERPRRGDRVGPFIIENEIGAGGMGVVMLARRDSDGAQVALKLLRPELAQDETYRARFLQEARAASSVSDRHLVSILDVGEADGRQFIAARYVPGRSLEALIRDQRVLADTVVATIVADVGGALDALHAHDIVHRDVKPSNVMIDIDGTALLTDFGLAKGSAYTVLTRPGQVMGTPDYLAPELIRGQRASSGTDIYALGCLAYEALCGHPPFAGLRTFQLLSAHLNDPPPAPAAERPDVPEPFAAALLLALEKQPARRPRTGAAYAEALAAAVSARP
ncbi:MAG: serine/threonine-protein kinase [Candidatus Limnocylindria bacterium]